MSKKICLCVGHGKSVKGGYDPGAVSRDGKYHEHQLARKIAYHASVYLGCDLVNYDSKCNLTDRINKVNLGKYDFAADIHLNAGGGTGVEVYYYHNSPTGRKAARKICGEISKTFGFKNRGAKVRLNSRGKDYFGFIRCTKPCAVLVECAFIDNANDLEKLKTTAECKKCGEAIGKALENVFKNEQTFLIKQKLNIRKGASTDFKTVGELKKGEKVKIILTSASKRWGKLKDGRGWINLAKCYVEEIG